MSFSPLPLFAAVVLALMHPSTVAAQAPTQPAHTAAEFEALARQVARLEVERYAIWREHLDRSFDAGAEARLKDLATERAALVSRLRPEPDGLVPHYRFNERVRAIVGTEIGPGWNRLMLERLPTPERLRADFPDDLEYLAALIVVGYEFTLGRTIRPPRTPELETRDAAYSRATGELEARIKPPADNLRALQRYEEQLHGMTRSAAFKREVLQRYVPLFASFIPDAPSDSATAAPERESILFRVVWERDNDPANDIVLGVVLLPAIGLFAVFGSVWWVWFRLWSSGRRDNTRGARSESGAAAIELPAELRHPALPGRMRPDLALNVGHIVDATTWSETHIATTTIHGNQFTPSRTQVSSTTVQKDRLWLRGIDGREQAWTVTDGVIAARPGHLLALVLARTRSGDERLALAYNHHSGQTYEPDWISAAHGRAWVAWLLVMAFWVAPLALAADQIAEAFGGGVTDLLLGAVKTLAVVLLGWAYVVRWWAVSRRRSVWQREFRPRVLEILQRLGRGLDRAEDQPAAE